MTKIEEVEECPTNTTGSRFVGRHVMQHVVKSKGTLDTVICCKDGRLGAHRIVLSAASKFLDFLIREQRRNEVIVLVLPDFRRQIVEALLCLAYTGKMFYAPEDEDEVLAALEALQFVPGADLELTMVTVKPKPKPLPPVIKTNPILSSSRGAMSHTSSPATKKLRVDDTRKEVNRTGRKINRKRQWLQIAKDPKTIRKSLFLKGIENNEGRPKTVRINLRKLPVVSVQLSRFGNNINIERTQNQPRFFHTDEEVQAYLKKKGLITALPSPSSDEESSESSSVDGRDDDDSSIASSSPEDNGYGDVDMTMSPNIMDTDWTQKIQDVSEMETQAMDIGLPSPPASNHDEQGITAVPEENRCHYTQHEDILTPDIMPLKPLNI